MKKIAGAVLISLFLVSGTVVAQETATVTADTVATGAVVSNEPIGAPGQAVKDVEARIKALNQEMESRIKAIRAEYKVKIDALRKEAKARLEAAKEKRKEIRQETKVKAKEVRSDGKEKRQEVKANVLQKRKEARPGTKLPPLPTTTTQ